MRLLFVADVNSSIARSWIRFFVERGDDVHIVSHYPPHGSALPGARLHLAPVVFSRLQGMSSTAAALRGEPARRDNPISRHLATLLRRANSWLGIDRLVVGYVGPAEARRVSKQVGTLVRELAPDLVHALRIPMEGESILRVPHTPIALSVWGNDFTLWAAHYRGHRKLTRAALLRADGLHADCQRDIRLAVQMGFDEARPHIVCPGNGGIHTSTEVPAARIEEWRKRLRVSSETPLVLNPRGRRLYIRTQEYLRAIPRVLALRPDTVFVSVGLAADPSTQRLARNLGLGSAHRALPTLPQEDLAALFAAATVVVSPSTHDGTPNTLLEAMAHGAFPVVGDLESIREWIEHGVNGLLVDPLRPDALAAGILRALDDKELRARAAERNRHLVRARADYATSMERVAAFYDSVIDSARARR